MATHGEMARHGGQRQITPQLIAVQLKKMVDVAGRMGITRDQINEEIARYLPANDNAGQAACLLPGAQTVVPSQLANVGVGVVPYVPAPGACAQDVGRLLAWIMRSVCSFNKFPTPGSVPLETNLLTIPDPDDGFSIGPDAAQLGVAFPTVWAAEAMFRAIFRIKMDIFVNILNPVAGALTEEQVRSRLFQSLLARIIQVGSEDPFTIVASFGEVDDARASTIWPATGGLWLPQGKEISPFPFQPDLQGYDFRGTAPGVAGVDRYTVRIRVTSYWTEVV